ncbi:MAG: DUF4340 domain-containing protein [Clostridiales bacterium]|nr:DUF4340 domain-containing protein [Clostridiales bacterium]
MSVSKSLKPILIGVIVIVVLALLLLVFMVIFPEKDKEVLAESTAPVSEKPVQYVIKEDGDSLIRLKAIRPDGETLTVDYIHDEDGKLIYDIEPKAKFFEYNTSKFRSMMFTLTSLTAVDFVEEAPEDLSIYGLDTPQYQMELTFEDGKVINLYIGDNTPVDYYYYAMTDVGNTVYTIGNYLTSLIMRGELDYRDIKTFPQYTDEDIYTNINWIRTTNEQGVSIEIILDSDFTIEGNKASSSYMMLSPVVSSCTDELVQEKMLDVAATITYGDIICDITAEQFEKYGLDKPRRFEMKDISGNSIDLVLGGIAGSSYTYAVMGEQYDAFMRGEVDEVTILTYASDAFECIKVDYTTLLNRAVWIQDIHTIESIVYDMAGTTYTMVLSEYDDVTGSGVEVVRTVGNINGKDISETNTKRMYSRTLNLRQVGELAKDIELGKAEYSITLNLKDGSSRLLEMIPLNERQYACRVDGNAEFYIYKSNIQTLVTAIERVMDDRNVSLVYTT